MSGLLLVCYHLYLQNNVTVNNIPYILFHFRQRAKLQPTLPKVRQDVTLDGKWTETTAGDKFLLADDGEENRIIVFATLENLMELSRADIWYVDGTFYSSPSYFYQMYTIHGMVDGYMCTLIYALLPNKRETTYRRLFELVQGAGDRHNIELKPETVMMDFEVAAKRAVIAVYPDITVKGCFFHYSQCIWRKVQSCGLVTTFKDNDDFRMLVRRASVLPLVPIGLVEDVWFHALENNDDDTASVVAFKDYVTEHWVDGDKAMWNHFDNPGPRTTSKDGTTRSMVC